MTSDEYVETQAGAVQPGDVVNDQIVVTVSNTEVTTIVLSGGETVVQDSIDSVPVSVSPPASDLIDPLEPEPDQL